MRIGEKLGIVPNIFDYCLFYLLTQKGIKILLIKDVYKYGTKELERVNRLIQPRLI